MLQGQQGGITTPGSVTPPTSSSAGSTTSSTGASGAADPYGLSGAYAQQQAAAQRAFEIAKANIASQRTGVLQRYGYNPDGSLDPTNKYGLYQQNEQGYLNSQHDLGVNIGADGKWSMDPTQQDGALAQIGRQRDQLQFNAGLKGIFDASGNPTDLTLSGDNQYGGYQQLLNNEGLQLDAAQQDALGRGLGTRGAGAKGIAQLAFGQGAERNDFRQQLLDQLTQNASSNRSAVKGIDQLIYNHGLNQNNMAQDLAGSLGGLDQNEYQATVDFNGALGGGMYQDIIDRINNGEFTPATAPGTSSASSSSGARTTASATTRKGAQVPNTAAKALAIRSAALNAKYGLNKKGGK